MMREANKRALSSLYTATPLLVAVVLIQATLVSRFHFFGASPNLLLTVIVAWSLLRGANSAMLYAFVGGLGFDLIAGLPLGVSSLALMTICFLVSLGEGTLFQGNVFLPIIACALATPVYGWTVLLSRQIGGHTIDWGQSTLRVILPELLLNVLLISAVYPLMRGIAQRFGTDRLDW